MKILVLSNDLTERAVIEQVVQANGHEMAAIETSETAFQLLQEGEVRFVIADRATTDLDEQKFIQRVRDAQPPYPIYILLLTPQVQETDINPSSTGADDFLRKPVEPLELRSRLQIGERILGLGDHLAVARDTLERVAMFDTLTGVLNQRAFIKYSQGELERARRGEGMLSLIALDIDNFKSINDRFGENIGNDVLTVVAKGIREKSRPYDGVGRYEADTFLIILPGVIGQDAERITRRILTSILNTEISLLDGRNIHVELSAGIAFTLKISAAMQVEALIAKAIEAMQRAKREGGNQVAAVFV
ncbi:MAG TPA: diguanylate cyclase [Anaerolineales bacterium]|nr:diguanylate cyclase [Anaerolineales bacterium]